MAETQKSQLASPFTFSQSSLQDYVECARRFQLRYIDRLEWPAVETEPTLENERRQQAGQTFHRLAQQAILGLPAEKLARLASGDDLARWWDHFLPQLDALRGVSAYPELSLSAPIAGHRLIAKYDLVALPQNRAVIYDWKTYHKRPRNEWMVARLQTRVYRYLLAIAGAHLNGGQPFAPEQIEMVYWYADFPTEPAIFRYDAAQFQRDQAFLESKIREIAFANTWPLTSDEQKCAFCTYRSHCDRGQAAGDWRSAEAEPEAEATLEINFEQIGEIEF